jgi:hypothetical protein
MCIRESVVLSCYHRIISVSIFLYRAFLFIFNLVFVLVFVTGVFCYSCNSGAVWPADCCSAAGRACSESAVSVLCSGFLWADGCADSNYCEVSSYSYFSFLPVGCFCGFVSVFLLLLAVVD